MKEGTYHIKNSIFRVRIVRIHHQTDKYVKVKLILTDRCGNVYQAKNYKLQKHILSHWELVSVKNRRC